VGAKKTYRNALFLKAQDGRKSIYSNWVNGTAILLAEFPLHIAWRTLTMIYNPYRNEPPLEPGSSTGAVILFSAVLLLLATIGGYLTLYAAGPSDQNIAANDNRPPITQPSSTGSSPDMPPAPQPRLEPKVKPVE
jgi:hypothetical protein